MARTEDNPPPQNGREPHDLGDRDRQDGIDWAARANDAARAVTRRFGHRLFYLPGTHIAAIVRPSNGLQNMTRPWHYWWQAQYLDCLVDAGRRELTTGAKFDGEGRPDAGRLASRLVTTIGLRNFFHYTNNYYDDMAWLALATLRLDGLAEESRTPGRRRYGRICDRLTLEFEAAATDELGGGVFWSRQRDFKNTPATAPVALFFARTGRTARAQLLLDWLGTRLFDPGRGLYLDGLRIRGQEVVLEDAVYTYNQGPVLGAFLAVGGSSNLKRAADLVAAVERHLCLSIDGPRDGRQNGQRDTVQGGRGRIPDAAPPSILRCDGTGDGGLFTGILVRYLALAARDGRLPAEARGAARRMVLDTAASLWAGRDENVDNSPEGRPTFPVHPGVPAREAYPPGTVVELSTQLQAWMALEAAATLD